MIIWDILFDEDSTFHAELKTHYQNLIVNRIARVESICGSNRDLLGNSQL